MNQRIPSASTAEFFNTSGAKLPFAAKTVGKVWAVRVVFLRLLGEPATRSADSPPDGVQYADERTAEFSVGEQMCDLPFC
jgi:hypothetical protein